VDHAPCPWSLHQRRPVARTGRRVRALTAAVAALAALVGLTACRTNVGTAAIIDGHRISESDVHKYLDPTGPTPSYLAAAAANQQSVLPKADVMTILVQNQVFAQTLAHTDGGLPSDAALNAAHDQAVQTLTGQSTTGAQFDAQVAGNLLAEGIKLNLLPILLHVVDLEYQLVVRTKAAQLSDLGTAVSKQHISVDINPAYGTWVPANVAVVQANSDLPNFLTLAPTYTPPTPSG
jgi:hypothetical protein